MSALWITGHATELGQSAAWYAALKVEAWLDQRYGAAWVYAGLERIAAKRERGAP